MTGPRVLPLTPEEAAPEVRPILETYLKERGNIPNMFRTAAVRPKHLQTMIAHFRTVMSEGTVPALLKELLWVHISHLNQCRYCLNSHTVLARRHGASDALVDAVQDCGSRVPVEALELGWRAGWNTRMSCTTRDMTSPTSCTAVWPERGIPDRSSRSLW